MEDPVNKSKCVLCDSVVDASSEDDALARRTYRYSCPCCGYVSVTDQAARVLRTIREPVKSILSGFCRERFESELPPLTITTNNLEDVTESANVPKTVSAKLSRVLSHLAKKSSYPGEFVTLDPRYAYPISYSKNSSEFNYLIEQLEKDDIVFKPSPKAITFRLTAKGWSRADELSRTALNSVQAFIAMWLTEETQSAYSNGIKKAVEECNYQPLRVDLLQHNERIDDRIIAEIRKSAFLVADFTGHRGGVYFETGFAMGLGIPVIWLCRKSDMDKTHFDTRQYNHIVWETESDLYEKLKARIEATIPQQ